jgi:ABC-2 type transport system ATP-binding protein
MQPTCNFAQTVQQKLEQVAGVSRVLHKESKDSRTLFTVESLQGRHIRPELARAVIESGWNLNELHSVGLSLEEIFLELTATPKPEPSPEPSPEPAAPVHVEAGTDGETK